MHTYIHTHVRHRCRYIYVKIHVYRHVYGIHAVYTGLSIATKTRCSDPLQHEENLVIFAEVLAGQALGAWPLRIRFPVSERIVSLRNRVIFFGCASRSTKA